MKGTDFRDLFMIYAKENTNSIRKYLKAGGSAMNRKHVIKTHRSERLLNKLMRLHWESVREDLRR